MICLLMQTLAKHVMNIHMNALQMSEEARPGELQLNTLKKYIAYCRAYVLQQFVGCLLQLYACSAELCYCLQNFVGSHLMCKTVGIVLIRLIRMALGECLNK